MMAFSHRARESADRSRDESSRGARPKFVTIATASSSNNNSPASQPRRTALKTSSDMAPPPPSSSAVGAIDREQKEGLVNIPLYLFFSFPLPPPFFLFWPVLGRGTQTVVPTAGRTRLTALFCLPNSLCMSRCIARHPCLSQGAHELRRAAFELPSHYL